MDHCAVTKLPFPSPPIHRRGRPGWSAQGPRPDHGLLVRHGRPQRPARSCRVGPGACIWPTPVGPRPNGSAERLAGLPRLPVAVYASPLERTRETAAPIARALGLPVQRARGLIECDVGDWTGAPLAKVAKTPEWSAVQRWPGGFRFPGGESFAEMTTRTVETVLSLVAAHPGQSVVAVSHADPIKAAVATASGVPLDLFQRLVVSPCSVSAVLYGEGGTAHHLR